MTEQPKPVPLTITIGGHTYTAARGDAAGCTAALDAYIVRMWDGRLAPVSPTLKR
jgi:hypothetical protein